MNRDKMVEYLKQNEVGSRTVYALPCHKQDTYLNIKEWRWAKFVKYPNYAALKLPNSEEIGAQHFEIPVHPSVTDQDRVRIEQVIRKALS
jgi:dTDP-4-amino-4,6-dideoxygalactose transaminase